MTCVGKLPNHADQLVGGGHWPGPRAVEQHSGRAAERQSGRADLAAAGSGPLPHPGYRSGQVAELCHRTDTIPHTPHPTYQETTRLTQAQYRLKYVKYRLGVVTTWQGGKVDSVRGATPGGRGGVTTPLGRTVARCQLPEAGAPQHLGRNPPHATQRRNRLRQH